MLSKKAYSAVALVKDTRQRHHTAADNLHRHSLHCKTSLLNGILKKEENLICRTLGLGTAATVRDGSVDRSATGLMADCSWRPDLGSVG